MAVVGYEREVTAQAGYRVGLSAGAKVVHVSDGGAWTAPVDALKADASRRRPAGRRHRRRELEVLRAQRAAARHGPVAAPIVLAGNVDARDEVATRSSARPGGRGRTTCFRGSACSTPSGPSRDPGRVHHAMSSGAKDLSKGPDFAAMVRAATPDVVLAGVEVLADGAPGPVSRASAMSRGRHRRRDDRRLLGDHADGRGRRPCARTWSSRLWRARTVEGDLGMRWTRHRRRPRRPASRRTSSRPPGGGGTTPASCPRRAPRWTRTRTSPGPPSRWPCAPRRALPGGGQPRGPRGRAERGRPA